MRVLSFGEILWDIINAEEHLGGAPFNFAAHAAKCGNESSIISRLGKDHRGSEAFRLCGHYGVKNDLLQWDDVYPTGYVNVVLDKGQPDYTIITDVAYDFIEVDANIQKASATPYDVFYFGSLAQRSSVSAETLRYILKTYSFRNIFYDVNLRKGGFTKEIIYESMKVCTILKLNIDEVPVIGKLVFAEAMENEAFCQKVRQSFPNINIVIITASDKGCYIFTDQLVHIAGKRVEVKDAVGAGDAFSAGFMHIFSQSGDDQRSARVANAIGAFVATQRGAIPEYSEDVKALLRDGGAQ